MSGYSAALREFEEKIGRKVDENFSVDGFGFTEKESPGLALIHLFEEWERTFYRLSKDADCLPLVVTAPSSLILKRSIAYSPNIATPIPDAVEDDWWNVYIPKSYVDWLRNYHELIRRDVACVVMGEFKKTDSTGNDTDVYKFESDNLNCAMVSDDNNLFSERHEDSLHFKVLLPDMSGVNLRDLLSLMDDEEIFLNYHNNLSSLNLKKKDDIPENRLRDMVLEVDDRTRELNAKFLQLSKKRTWQAIRSMGGLSLTGFSYFLPPDIGVSMRAIFGTLSAVSIADGLLGVAHEKDVLMNNPYYFSYLVNKSSRNEISTR